MVRVRVDQCWPGASGKTGSRVRFQVKLATPAHDAYQASAAVIRPSQPPSCLMTEVWLQMPMVRATKVSVRTTKTASTTPLTRAAAIVI